MRAIRPVLSCIVAGAVVGSLGAFFGAAALAAEAATGAADAANPGGTAAALVARGQYLADAGNCISCHTLPGRSPYAGGRPFITPFGIIYSSNITPDANTGIGQWTGEDLRRAMHQGIAAGGYRLFPAFPYTSFTKVSDGDVDAIYAFLRSIAPVHYTPPANSFLLRQRWAMRFWNMLFFKPGRFRPAPGQSAAWNRGAYLVEGLGHCGACHSPRNLFMAEIGSEAYTGGKFQDRVIADKVRTWSGVNLTSAATGIAAWSADNLAKYLQTGFCSRAGTFGPMNEVIVGSLKNLSADDTHAMATYLKSLPAKQRSSATVAETAVDTGAAIYKDHCEECHMSSGRGGVFDGPPLQGSAVAQADDPASLINIILYGPAQPKDLSFGGWETMKPYNDVLTDAELAAVANYVRGSWGNHGSAVTTDEVARQR